MGCLLYVTVFDPHFNLHFMFLLDVLQACSAFDVQYAQTMFSRGTSENTSCAVFGCRVYHDNSNAFQLIMS